MLKLPNIFRFKILNNKQENFLFKNCFQEDEIQIVLDNSHPLISSKFEIESYKTDFNRGDFSFFIRGKNKKIFEIPFHNTSYNINSFWEFLEILSTVNEAVIYHLFYKGEEIFIYANPLNKTDIRFTVMDTIELKRKEKEGEILKYSYSECFVDIDIIVSRKKVIREFYNKLFEIFKNYENIAYFEPPIIDFNFWVKDSDILRNYLKKRRLNNLK